MTYFEQWKALSSRINGIVQEKYLDDHDLGGQVRDYLFTLCERVFDGINRFRENHQNDIPSLALTTIDDFLSKNSTLFHDGAGTPDTQRYNTRIRLILLELFSTELTYLLGDAQLVIRSRTERAFSHLQRSIVVDPEIRQKWCTAFKEGETTLEKFGAVHLLLHGIWAFKVNAEGERTDLVYNEPAGDLVKEQSFADGLVLTEWKKANTPKEAQDRYEQARSQMSRYQHGALGGMELTGYRYAIVVTEKHLKTTLPEITEGSVIYRPINIVVDPDVPSKG